jgi:hypothetical protein
MPHLTQAILGTTQDMRSAPKRVNKTFRTIIYDRKGNHL